MFTFAGAPSGRHLHFSHCVPGGLITGETGKTPVILTNNLAAYTPRRLLKPVVIRPCSVFLCVLSAPI